MTDLSIALVQTSLFWEDPEKNLEMLGQKVLKHTIPSDIILLPEMFSTGFTMNAEKLAEAPNGRTFQWMRKMATEKNSILVGSIIIREENKFFNRLIWMQPNGAFTHYDKRHLFRLAGEELTYTAGQHQWIMVCKGWKIFPLICYDLRFPVWSRRTKNLDYDVLLYVANWPERRSSAWRQLLPARAIENQTYVAAVNRTGNDGNEIYHSGESIALDFKGEVLIDFETGKEEIKNVIFNFNDLQEHRNRFPFSRDADDFKLNIV